MSLSTKDTVSKLKDRGLRITKLRHQLIDFIVQKQGHWTIQSLAEEAKSQLPGVGIATIYRTVNLLVEEGAVTKTLLESGMARFEVTPQEHHDHLTCLRCGKIVEFENDQIEDLQKKIAKKLGFQLTDHRMELYGECLDEAACQRRAKRAQKS